MSMVTVGKNGRVYQRAFDHDDARRLRDQGWAYKALAEHFQVSENGVQRVLNPSVHARIDKQVRANIERKRQPCKGGCGRRVWMHGKVGRARSGYCRACSSARRATSVRETTLRCACCGEWKPDADFPLQAERIARRGRHSTCRPCQTVERRRRRREANPDAFNEYQRDYNRRVRARKREARSARDRSD